MKVSLKNKMLKKKRPYLRKTMRFMRKSTLERKSKRELLEVCQLWGKQVTELICVSVLCKAECLIQPSPPTYLPTVCTVVSHSTTFPEQVI